MTTTNKASEQVTNITAETGFLDGLRDLLAGLLGYEQWLHFAWQEIRQRFRRSVLGPFWITLSMGVLVAALGVVFGGIFQQSIDNFLPYLATGLIFWGLLTSITTEGSNVFISASTYIRDIPMPTSSHYFQLLARNLIIWAHNMVIYLLVFVVFIREVNINFLFFIPGFLLFFANASWVGLSVGILSTRFRDIPQVITNAVQVIFFVTPVFWSLEFFPSRPAFVTYNPAYHLLELVRAPLLGNAVPMESWLVGAVFAIIGWIGTLWLFGRGKSRIPHWI